MNIWFKLAIGSLFCGLSLALLCLMITMFGLAVLPAEWGWRYHGGERIADMAMVFLPGGFFFMLMFGAIGVLLDCLKEKP